MTFKEKQKIYAELIVAHGLNIQSGQVVNISTEAYHSDFAQMILEAAYDRGAKYVSVDLTDPRHGRARLLKSNEEDLKFVPAHITTKYKDLVDSTAANLKLIGSENPDIYSDLDPKRINTVRLSNHMAVKYFYDEGIGKSLVHWTVAAAATPAWGQKVFPDSSAEEAEEKLWEELFRICRADTPDCLARWQKHNDALHHRGKTLTELKIEELHFTGNGSDLIVGLSDKAIFKGGSDTSPLDVEFEPNLPTEEVFTTPDYRKTNGTVNATRPFLINGKLIEDLSLEFKDGQIVNFSAKSGEETFKEYIASDEGANRLGEVALVGIDSPIYQSGLVFQEILLDENAACHIAVGSAYKFCLAGGDKMTKEDLANVGCNESTVHTDMMISNENVNVTAKTHDGKTIELIKAGSWLI